MKNYIDNPSRYYHYKYQRMVDRWFIFVISLLSCLQIVLNFTPEQIIKGVVGVIAGGVILFIAGGVLVILLGSLVNWLSGD